MDATPHRKLGAAYLLLSLIGFVAAGVPMIQETLATGNILFWTKPALTTSELFVNRTSSAFALDLFAVVLTALVWMWAEARRLGMHGAWRYWLLTLVFGLGGTLPLFLYFRERALAGSSTRTQTGR